MGKCFLFSSLLLLATSSIVRSQFNTGATTNECVSLEPSGSTPSSGTAPIIVAVTAQHYTPRGNAINVFIASTDSSLGVQGLVLQARRTDGTDTTPVGSFSLPTSNNLYRSLTCGTSTTGTITNTDGTTKTLPLTFEWTPPVEEVGDVSFFLSVSDTNGDFWSRITQRTPLPPSGLTIDPCPTPNVQGSQVTWTSPDCLRNNVPLDNSAACDPASGSTFSLGNTEVTCTCQDQDASASCMFVITITDQNPCNPNPCQNGGACIEVAQLPSGFFCQCPAGFNQPTCTDGVNNPPDTPNCPGPQTATAPIGSNSVSVQYSPVQCNDMEDGVFLANCIPPSGFQFGIETTAVVCTCADSGGLVSSCSFTVTVSPPGIPGGACDGNPCSGNECRVSTNSLAGYTCHSVVGTPCL